MSTESLRIQDDKFSSLGLTRTIVNEEQVLVYSRGLAAASEKNPILVLIHGYPQSSYEWRLLIPLLPKDAPIFAPDLPGYGGSAPIPQNDKLTVGNALVSALKTEVKRTTSTSSFNIPIVLIAHDRGARVAHRLAVSGYPGVDILGVTFMDIVPTSTQWQTNASPVTAAKEIMGYFHWPFLATGDLAVRMISAYGGSRWVQELTLRWAGTNPAGLAKLQSDDSLAVYGGYFEREDTIKASCDDYKHGATTDLEMQEEDQKQGKKIGVPVLLIYSVELIGKRFDFGTVWNEWVKEGVQITKCALGNGIGHFGAEEAPEECVEAIGKWLETIRSGGS